VNVTITPSRLRGSVTPPPSKSQAHRLVIAAALAEGESIISNLALSQDIEATLRCMEALGASWECAGEGAVRICGVGGRHRDFGDELPLLDCGESGSTLRFLIPVALALAGGGRFAGRGRLMERPQGPYFEIFREKGIAFELKDGVLTVRGRLTPGEYRLPGDVSSQFFTGLLCALPLLDGASEIYPTTRLESQDYIVMTMDALEGAGVYVTEPGESGGCFKISPSDYHPVSRAVEPDWSQAAFWYAAEFLGSDVKVTGMNENSCQGDKVIRDFAEQFSEPENTAIYLSDCPDLAPPLAAMAALRNGTTHLAGAARLRIKESDRLATIHNTMSALGADIEEGPDSLTIHGLSELRGGVTVDCCNDHRIAMMAAIAVTRCRESVTLTGAECVAKSYPDFWDEYRRLGGKLQ